MFAILDQLRCRQEGARAQVGGPNIKLISNQNSTNERNAMSPWGSSAYFASNVSGTASPIR